MSLPCPFKRPHQCYALLQSNFHEYKLCKATMQVKRDIPVGNTSYMYQYVTTSIVHALVMIFHIIWHNLLLCFQIVKKKTLLHGFDPYITFYVHCSCATFSCARTHCIAVKCSIEFCLL